MRFLKTLGVRARSIMGRALAVGGATAGGIATASAEVVLPDTGVDAPGHVNAAITALGATIVAVVGGYFAFLIIKKVLKWSNRIA